MEPTLSCALTILNNGTVILFFSFFFMNIVPLVNSVQFSFQHTSFMSFQEDRENHQLSSQDIETQKENTSSCQPALTLSNTTAILSPPKIDVLD